MQCRGEGVGVCYRRFTVQGLWAEHVGTDTSANMMVGISTFSVNWEIRSSDENEE